jgi:hypothetical protein
MIISMVDGYHKRQEGNQKDCYLKGIVGRYSLLDELGYSSKSSFSSLKRGAGNMYLPVRRESA